jgi:hypothetical protein
LSTINRTYISSAIVGRPSVSTSRPVSRNSCRQRSTNGHNNPGSDSNTSNAARSSGNSLTSIGKASSHRHSGCSAKSVSINSPFDEKTHHQQGILTVTPDGQAPLTPIDFFRGK